MNWPWAIAIWLNLEVFECHGGDREPHIILERWDHSPTSLNPDAVIWGLVAPANLIKHGIRDVDDPIMLSPGIEYLLCCHSPSGVWVAQMVQWQ